MPDLANEMLHQGDGCVTTLHMCDQYALPNVTIALPGELRMAMQQLLTAAAMLVLRLAAEMKPTDPEAP